MGGTGGRNKKKKENQPMGLGESSKSDAGSDGGRKGWMTRFSTMKVGPPRHAKPTMRNREAEEQNREERVTG